MSVLRVNFFSEGITFDIKRKKLIRDWISRSSLSEGYSIQELNYIFSSDDVVLEINKSYLDHDTFTDIITFDNSENKDSISGEIYISIDRIKENAAIFKQSFEHELFRVMIHGVLHLCGYGDKSSQEKEEMTNKETYYLSDLLKVL